MPQVGTGDVGQAACTKARFLDIENTLCQAELREAHCSVRCLQSVKVKRSESSLSKEGSKRPFGLALGPFSSRRAAAVADHRHK